MALDPYDNNTHPGYRTQVAPQANKPGVVRNTGIGVRPQPKMKDRTWNGHVIPKDNSGDSPLVGVDIDAAYTDTSISPYMYEYARPYGTPDNVQYKPTGPFKHNTWAELKDMETWGEDRMRDLQKRLVKAGWLSKQSITGSFSEATQNAMKALMYAGNRSGNSWGDILTQSRYNVLNRQSDNAGDPSGTGKDVPQDFTQVSTSYNKLPKRDALTAVKDAMQEDLGRAPTDDEVQGFIKDLRQFERANPTVTTTEHKFEKQGDEWVDNPITTTEQGADPAGLIDDYAEKANPKAVKRYKKANMLADIIDGIANGTL